MSDVEHPDLPETPLPPASFSFLVLSLRAQAEMQLGLPDLPMARHTIDMLGVLLEKTKSNLSLDEQRLLEKALTDLRFRFVQVSDEAAKPVIETA